MVVDVAAVTQGVDGCMGAGFEDRIAVGVILVHRRDVARGIHQTDHIALGVGDVVV